MLMIKPIRCLLILGLLLVGAHFRLGAGAQTKPISKAATGTISGRVTLQGKGKAGIIVSLGTPQLGAPRTTPIVKATTDADGNYRITDVPAGFYHVAPLAPEFVVPDVNQNPYGPRGKALQLTEGESVEDVDFAITRGAVITGKVTHADGRPVVEEQLNATLEQSTTNAGSLQRLPFQTDDRGVYRIYGLLPGRYKISVGQGEDSFFSINRGRPSFERVYYPDVRNSDEARVIELAEGGEATNIDITVGKKVETFSATGRIVDGENDQPLASIRFGLQKIVGENRSFMGTNAMSNPQGEFRLDNIPPGKYAVFVLPQPNSPAQAEAVPFEIIDQDVTGITVRTSTGATVSGIVVIEGTSDKTVLARLGQFELDVNVRGVAIGAGFGQSVRIGPGGSFRLGGVQAGTANFSLGNGDRNPPKGFSLARIEREGVVQARGLEIKAGEQVTGVRVVFAYATGIIRGTLKVENGPLPGNSRAMVWVSKPGDTSFQMRPQEIDSRGHFVIEGVPAGTFDLRVTVYILNSRQRPPMSVQSITMTEGSTLEVEVPIDLNPKRDSPPQP